MQATKIKGQASTQIEAAAAAQSDCVSGAAETTKQLGAAAQLAAEVLRVAEVNTP